MEMWPRGRRHSPAKGAYGPKLVSRVRIPSSPPEFILVVRESNEPVISHGCDGFFVCLLFLIRTDQKLLDAPDIFTNHEKGRPDATFRRQCMTSRVLRKKDSSLFQLQTILACQHFHPKHKLLVYTIKIQTELTKASVSL